ncbi:MAG: FkbM family methyltransferase [Litoreibacter sp.]|nr:FkbM family methyltransferase [Litoreibacter sp.]
MAVNVRQVGPEDEAHAADFFDAGWGEHLPSALQKILIGLTRKTPLQRGRMRHKMTNLITGMGRPIDITFRGLRFRIEGRNNLIEYGLLTRPSYNGAELDFLCEGLRDGDVALDIGCNIGLYSMHMARAVGATGKVVSIDANPQMIKHLNFHAQANEFEHIHAVFSAVGDSVGQVDLLIRSDDVAIVRVEESDAGVTPMRPLADIVREAGLEQVDALKIDIEGHEDKALVPYFSEMPEAFWPDRIVIEYLAPDDYPGCAQAFRERGYKLVGRTKSNSMYLRG